VEGVLRSVESSDCIASGCQRFPSVRAGAPSMQDTSTIVRGAREQLAQLQAACETRLRAKDGGHRDADVDAFMRDYEQRVHTLRTALLALDVSAASTAAPAVAPSDVLARRATLREQGSTLNAQLLALASDMMDVERAADMASALPDL
jgi:hypothetical protein